MKEIYNCLFNKKSVELDLSEFAKAVEVDDLEPGHELCVGQELLVAGGVRGEFELLSVQRHRSTPQLITLQPPPQTKLIID